MFLATIVTQTYPFKCATHVIPSANRSNARFKSGLKRKTSETTLRNRRPLSIHGPHPSRSSPRPCSRARPADDTTKEKPAGCNTRSQFWRLRKRKTSAGRCYGFAFCVSRLKYSGSSPTSGFAYSRNAFVTNSPSFAMNFPGIGLSSLATLLSSIVPNPLA